MSEVIHEAQHDFWRPPAIPAELAALPFAEACHGCGTEFMVGSKFCHVCGATRTIGSHSQASNADQWLEAFEFLRALEFQSVKAWFGVSTASLIAFLAGIGCLLAAIMVGIIYSAQNFNDFQAIQLWRIQWLLGAVAAFAAAILLRKSGSAKS